ncbi:hypothetical protein DY000_02032197, partial [Brassica cretica]
FFTNLSLLGSGRSQKGEFVGGYSPAHFEGLSVNHFNVISVYFCCFLWILSEERISQWNGPVSPTMLLLGPDFELRSAYYVAKWTSKGLPLIVSGSDDGTAKLWDMRALSPDGSYLLTNAMDCKLCVWVMGYVSLWKCVWSPDGSKMVHAWVMYKLPGHNVSVSEFVVVIN